MLNRIFCYSCGKQINIINVENESIYCPYCGAKMSINLKSNEITIGENNKLEKRTTNASSNINKLVYNVIKDYLLELVPEGIDINKYLINKNNPYTSFNDILYVFLVSMQDYQYLPGVIGLTTKPERKEIFEKIFFDYDHKRIIDKYNEETLFKEFCNSFPVKNANSKQNSWRRYAKSVLSACRYLNRFDTAEQFNNYILSFDGSLDIVYEFNKSIYGMGFAIACNTIKDLGFVDYSKPDTHLISVMHDCGLASNDVEEVFYKIRDIAKDNNDTPFNVDRMIWLVCSGNYFYDNYQIISRKDELIKRIKEGIKQCQK